MTPINSVKCVDKVKLYKLQGDHRLFDINIENNVLQKN